MRSLTLVAIFILVLVLFIQPFKAYKCPKIMEGIYGDILKIQSRYDELKNFGNKNLRLGLSMRDGEIRYDLWKFDKEKNRQMQQLWIYLYFANRHCDYSTTCSPTPTQEGCKYSITEEVYLKKIGLFFTYTLQTPNEDLYNELLKIVEANIQQVKG